MEIDGIPGRTIGKPELFRTVGAAFWRTSIVMTSMKSTTEICRGRIYLVNEVELTRESFDLRQITANELRLENKITIFQRWYFVQKFFNKKLNTYFIKIIWDYWEILCVKHTFKILFLS